MGRILIRNLDDAVIAALKRRAADNGVSAEEEARRALTAGVGLDREALIDRLRAVRAETGRAPGPSIVDDLRADRARDDNR